MAKREHITQSEQQDFRYLCRQTKPLLILNLMALIICICGWHLFFQKLPLAHPYIVLFAAILPLILVLPGVLSGGYRGAIWTCFVTLFYFMAGILNWVQVSSWAYGMSETLLSMLLFMLALMYARWKGLSELPVKG